MAYTLQTFSEGTCKSFLDNTINKIKKSLTVDRQASNIDCFFRPIITALFDTVQVQSIHARSMALLNKGSFFKKGSTPFSNQAFLAFLLAKTSLNVTTSLARGAISQNTKRLLKKVHDGMESLLPVASAIVAIASMNLIYISAYFLYLGLSYLGEHNSLSRDMKSICQYSSTILGISSLLILRTPNSLIF